MPEAIENHNLSFNNLADVLKERLLQYKEGKEPYYICDRINDNIGFLSVYKDALFQYTDGIVLCERLYKENGVQYEEQNIPKYSEENKKLYDDFLKFTNESKEKKDMSQEEIAKQLKEYMNKFKSENIPVETIQLPYHQILYGAKNKLLLKKLSDISNEVLDIMSMIIAEHILSFFQTMFLTPNTEYGIILKNIECAEYNDIIAIFIKKQS